VYSWNGSMLVRNDLPGSEGWWNTIKATDLDGDGDIDLVGGNLGANSKFRATPTQPTQLFVSDFDDNGQSECILTYYKTDSLSYPFPLRGELVAQLPNLKKRFLKYSDYGGQPIDVVLTEEERQKALVLSVKNPLSCMFINNGKGEFQVTPLPMQAQLAPLYAIVIEDFNDDGKKDLFLAGNFSGVRPEIGGYDANYGQVFLGDGNNHFTFIPNKFSGINIRGEARDAVVVKGKNGKKAILVTMNNGQPYLYQVN